jgi:hypothetical protein
MLRKAERVVKKPQALERRRVHGAFRRAAKPYFHPSSEAGPEAESRGIGLPRYLRMAALEN